MAKLTRDSALNRAFSDSKNYPYGFSRSGDFSISESKALAQSGNLIVALVDGLIAPETDSDHAMLAAAFGKQLPSSLEEKAWVKYQTRINRPKLSSIYGKHNSEIEEDNNPDNDPDSDDDIEIDLDED